MTGRIMDGEQKVEKPVETAATGEPGGSPRRVIKRYSNRKLYDTKDSRYVTLLQIAEMVRSGEEVQIIDNNTKDDLTELTLAQIVYEEQKTQSRAVPLQTLKELIQQRTEKVLSDLREGPIGRFIPGRGSERPAGKPEKSEPLPSKDPTPSRPLVQQARESLSELQQRIDERIRAILPSILPWQQLENEVRRLNARVEELEKKLKTKSGGKDS
jgi:polyhydroxyalkanoate synthesis repressor PhaR